MGLMSLALGTGTVVTLSVDGNDEGEAIKELSEFVEQEG
jgi:catabolite repression HPr-like protein